MKKLLSLALSLLMIVTMVASPLMITSAEETEKEYAYAHYDFEDGNIEGFIGSSIGKKVESVTTRYLTNEVSLDTNSAISGNNSLHAVALTSDVLTGCDYTAVSLQPTNFTFTSKLTYRVSGKLKNTSGYNLSTVWVGSTNKSNDDFGVLNWSNMDGGDVYKPSAPGISNSIISFSGSVTKQYTYFAIMLKSAANTGPYDVYIDDITIAEVVDTVAAVSSDEAKGTVTLANSNSSYTDFAVNETAVFTATANDGFEFDSWTDANGNVVSNDAVYEHTVTTDVTLTANFKTAGATVVFNTNGGNDIANFNVEYEDTVYVSDLPTAVKDDYKFIGWYTDEALTTPFISHTANTPAETVNLYARYSLYTVQDFENYNLNISSSVSLYDATLEGNSTDNTHSGNYSVTLSGDKTSTGGFTIKTTKLNTDTTYKVTMSVKTVSVADTSKLILLGLAYNYTNTNFWNSEYSEGSLIDKKWIQSAHDWKSYTFTINVARNDIFSDYVLTFATYGGRGEVYVDDITIEEVPASVDLSTTVNYCDETVKLKALDGYDMSAAVENAAFCFKACHDEDITPVITYGGETVTPVKGIYTVIPDADKTLEVDGTGDLSEVRDHAVGTYDNKTLTQYSADTASVAIWEGETVYHESVMFYDTTDTDESFEHTRKTAKLLYPIDEIVSVRNRNLNTYYVKGVDFDVVDGQLVWLEGGDMPIFTGPLRSLKTADDTVQDPTVEKGNSTVAASYPTDGVKDGTDGYGLTLYSDTLASYSVFVTYKHTTDWEDQDISGAAPEAQGDKIEEFYNKLASGDAINVLVYGDSTATGASSTGKGMNYELFSDAKTFDDVTVTERASGYGIEAPTFFEQATAKMVSEYGKNNTVNYYNLAVGGNHSNWGAQNLETRIGFMNTYYGTTITPDIVYIHFGANDTGIHYATYAQNFKTMIDVLREHYPNATVVMVTDKINNTSCLTYQNNMDNVLAQQEALIDLAENYDNCIVATTVTLFTEILKSKQPEDYLSNNINHGNDWWGAVCGQVITAAMKKSTTVDEALAQAFDYKGHSIRPIGENGGETLAIRIKNRVNKSALEENAILGQYTITEYGFVAMRTANKSTYEAILENVSTKKVFTGVAYKSDGTKNVVFEDKGAANIFNAAIKGIKSNYITSDYTIRIYVKVSDGNTYYLDMAPDASLFDVGKIAYETAGSTYTDISGAGWNEAYQTRCDIFSSVLKENGYEGEEPVIDANDQKYYATVTSGQSEEDGSVEIVKSSYVAVPYDGNDFLGWYNENGELVSSEVELSILEMECDVVAKFQNNNMLYGIAGGFEYDKGNAITYYEKAADGTEPVIDETSKTPYIYAPAYWAGSGISTAYSYNGSQSLYVACRNNAFRLKSFNYKTNTNYTVSFWWYLDVEGDEACYFERAAALPGSVTTYSSSSSLGANTTKTVADKQWHKVTFEFNTGENTDINLFFNYHHSSKNVNFYIDNLTIYESKN